MYTIYRLAGGQEQNESQCSTCRVSFNPVHFTSATLTVASWMNITGAALQSVVFVQLVCTKTIFTMHRLFVNHVCNRCKFVHVLEKNNDKMYVYYQLKLVSHSISEYSYCKSFLRGGACPRPPIRPVLSLHQSALHTRVVHLCLMASQVWF